MAADTFGADAAANPQRFGTIVVVGGGCYGSYYVRQLKRARLAGAVSWRAVLVVDRDERCRVATELREEKGSIGLEVVVEDWSDFFRGYFAQAGDDRERSWFDAIVPSPLMPHLLFEWLRDSARRRWPERVVETRSLERPPNLPWQRASPNGAHYVSFAEWMCPINCIEPPLCPHIRGPRTWSMPRAARAYVAEEHHRGRALAGPIIFHCTHRAYGVGMIDTRELLAADDQLVPLAAREGTEVLVGTMSHCHGVFEVLSVAPPTPGFANVPR